MHGKGVVYYKNGTSGYFGELRTGQPNGYGIYYNSSGDFVYSGMFTNGNFHGYGKLMIDNKPVIGTFLNNIISS